MTEAERLSVTLTREFNAPIDLVFSAWTDANHVVRWMKCDANVTLTVGGWEPKVGQKYTTRMEMPGQWTADGTGTFLEVDPPRLLVYRSDADEAMGAPEMTVRVELEDLGDDRTKLTLTHSGIPSDEMCGIIQGGWSGGLEMLDELLAARA